MLEAIRTYTQCAPQSKPAASGATQGIISQIAQLTWSFISSSYACMGRSISPMVSRISALIYTPSRESRSKVHKQQCDQIVKTFRAIISTSNPVVLEPKPTTFLYRPRQLSSCRLDLRGLNKVISIDTNTGIAHVQGLTTFYDLFEETIKKSYRPKVVPELRGITLGGAISGLAVESSSFKQGLVHHSVIEMEVLTGAGEIVSCSPTNHKELFYGIPNSYGTLGYILSAKIKLEPAKPYVDVNYLHFHDCKDFFANIETLCQKTDEYDFIDGAIFSPEHMVIVAGKAVDAPSYTPAADYVKQQIYHKAIRVKDKESFKLKDYIWRWDHDSFWSTEKTLLENPLVRKSIGPYLLRTDRLSKLTRFISNWLPKFATKTSAKQPTEELIQDVGVPINKCPEFYAWFQQEIGIHPLFICPVQKETLSTPLWRLPENNQIYCDVGFFSRKKTSFVRGHYNRLVEDKLVEIGGRKSLYSRTYYPEEQFKKLYYGEGAYEKLKAQYDPYNKLPTLFDKCVKGR